MLRGASAVRRRSETNRNGGPQTPASGLPVNGGGVAAGQGPGGPSTGRGRSGQGPAFGQPEFGGQAGQATGPNRLPGGGAVRRDGEAAGGQPALPVPITPARRTAAAAPSPRKKSRLALSNWRVRWRLVAIIAVPTITAMVLGGFLIGNQINNVYAFQRVQSLANLNQAVVQAAGTLENERDIVAGYIAAGRPAGGKPQVTAAENATNSAVAQVVRLSAGIGSAYNSGVVLDLDNGVLANINDLTNIRAAALGTNYPALAVISRYTSLIQAFTTFSGAIASGTGNVTLQNDVGVLAALLRVENDASEQRGILYEALSSPKPALPPIAQTTLAQAQQQQSADESQFQSAASVQEAQTFGNVVSGQPVDEAASEEELATTTAAEGLPLTIGTQQTCATLTPAACWYGTQSTVISDMESVSSGPNGLVGDIISQANSLESSAVRNAAIIGAVTLVLLLLVLLITTFVARSMIRPLRKLRSDALDVAGSRLPEMVRRLSESEGDDESIEIEPIGVSSTDEIGEVARAFDQVHREAVRLAADEAMLRGNLNAMFVNLSRRSQSLIERQLALIDNLEQSEQDPDRLSSLFRLDHLATRMRRNSENLLVLAGHEASRKWSQPVPLVDVLRAAISEIEQYERVVLNVQPGIVVVGQAVNDVVHLVAEIVENATTFSPEDTQVYVTGQPLTSGGVLLDITDNGVGISEQEMAHANWRLDNPPVVDVAVSRRMGLFVVGRLAARHGVRVRLRHAQSGGLTALIWLPESVAAPEAAQSLGRLRRFETEDFGPAPSLSAPTSATDAPAPAFGQPFNPGGGDAASAAAAAARIPRFSGAFRPPGRDGGAASGSGGVQDTGAVQVPPLPVRPTAAPANGTGTPGQDNEPGQVAAFGGIPQVGEPAGGAVGTPGSRLPSFTDGAPAGSSGTGPMAMPAAGTGPTPANSGQAIGAGGSDGSQVTIPPIASPAQDQRLPIFDSLESDWFRRSGKTLTTASATAAAPAAQSWSSPADEGWRAARVVASPAAGETTTAGLPKRVPRANLVPGSVGGGAAEEAETAAPSRSADAVRSRMSSFQRGVREARAAAPENEEP
jgi:signal transduction histidine kinase